MKIRYFTENQELPVACFGGCFATKLKLNDKYVYMDYGYSRCSETEDFHATYSCRFALACCHVWDLECRPVNSIFVEWIEFLNI